MPGPAKPYVAGQPSPNPGGRPKKTDDMRRGEELMRSRSEQGVRDLIDLSEKSADDNVRARLLQFRYEAVFGKAVQSITAEIEHRDGSTTGELVRHELARLLTQLAPKRPPIEAEAVVVQALPSPKVPQE